MTREEIIKEYEDAVAVNALAAACGNKAAAKAYELFKAGLHALRPISQEQVEKGWRGEWIDGVCRKCGFDAMYYKDVPVQVYTKFCPNCGAAQTDEAVEMVMDRLEGIK